MVCPFHGFTYDASGACVSTPTALPTPACRLTAFPVAEVNGFVFAWFDKANREPRWTLPVANEEKWTRTATHRYRIRSHPQETTENTIDLNHLRFLHDFEAVRQVGSSELHGPHFKTGFRFEGTYNIPILRSVRFELIATVSIWGLGFLFVETVAPTLGVTTMNWFLTTPIDGAYVDILVSAKVQAMRQCDASNSLITRTLSLFPGAIAAKIDSSPSHARIQEEHRKRLRRVGQQGVPGAPAAQSGRWRDYEVSPLLHAVLRGVWPK